MTRQQIVDMRERELVAAWDALVRANTGPHVTLAESDSVAERWQAADAAWQALWAVPAA